MFEVLLFKKLKLRLIWCLGLSFNLKIIFYLFHDKFYLIKFDNVILFILYFYY